MLHYFMVSSSNPRIHRETDRSDHDACFFHGLLISLGSERLAKIDEKASISRLFGVLFEPQDTPRNGQKRSRCVFFHGLLISLGSERLTKIDVVCWLAALICLEVGRGHRCKWKFICIYDFIWIIGAVNSNDYTCSIREHWSYREVGCV